MCSRGLASLQYNASLEGIEQLLHTISTWVWCLVSLLLTTNFHLIKFIMVFTYNVIKLTAEVERHKLLLAAKKIRRATSTDFVISLVAEEFSRASSKYVGKLRQV